MPVLLKSKNKNSPGIIVFTHGEALWGVPAKSKKVKKFLLEISQKKEWIFGIHVQGNVDWIGKWQKQNWQQFFMKSYASAVGRVKSINYYTHLSVFPIGISREGIHQNGAFIRDRALISFLRKSRMCKARL